MLMVFFSFSRHHGRVRPVKWLWCLHGNNWPIPLTLPRPIYSSLCLRPRPQMPIGVGLWLSIHLAASDCRPNRPRPCSRPWYTSGQPWQPRPQEAAVHTTRGRQRLAVQPPLPWSAHRRPMGQLWPTRRRLIATPTLQAQLFVTVIIAEAEMEIWLIPSKRNLRSWVRLRNVSKKLRTTLTMNCIDSSNKSNNSNIVQVKVS